MKTIKYILLYAGIISLLSGLTGCNDDKFLEEEPFSFYTTSNVFSTPAQVDQILISLHNSVRDLWANTSAGWDYMNFRLNGTDMFDVTVLSPGSSFNDYGIVNPDHGTFRGLYNAFYTMIARANLAIYAAELPQIVWASEQDKAYVLAQAKFFRAFCYRNLAELFGGVSLVTEVVTAPRYDYTRAGHVETYEFITGDLESILNDLPETTVEGGRIVRGAAQHLLSELYLAKGVVLESEGKSGEAQADYSKAVSYAGAVIDGGIYSLMNERFGKRKDETFFSIDIHPSGNAALAVEDTIRFDTNHYWDLFQDDNINYQDGNRECIWALQIDYTAYKNEDKESFLRYTQMYSPLIRDGASGIIGGILEDIGGRPNAFITMNWYARDLIWEGKFGADIRNSDAVFRRRFKGNVPTSDYYLKDIPWEVFYNRESDPTLNVRNSNMCYPLSCKVYTDRYVGLADGQVRQNLFRDDYMFRLSETILLRAEAKQRSGDKAGAAADVNLLRNRARCAYLVTAADMDDKFDMILDERARELIYEEDRWNTLLRMGGTIAVDRIKKYSFYQETVQSTLTFNYNLWPIPQSIIDINKNAVLEQNPGWENR
jgi:hypothetical protein